MNVVAGLLLLIVAVAGSGAMMWIIASFHARIRQLEQGGGGEQLARQIEALRQELMATREDVSELYERVEFAERLLTRGKEES